MKKNTRSQYWLLLMFISVILQTQILPAAAITETSPPAGSSGPPLFVSLKRQRRQVFEIKEEQEVDAAAAPVDDFDMEFAEVNVFRPLFRYRVARVQNQQFG